MLHRHWTLFDAMYHSDFVATKMGTWVSETMGRQKLDTLLVNIGIPKKESSERCGGGELVLSPPTHTHTPPPYFYISLSFSRVMPVA